MNRIQSKVAIAVGLAAAAIAAVLVWIGFYRAEIPVAEASSRPGYQGEAEYNAFDRWDVDTNIHLPFVSSDPAWEWRTAATVQNTYTGTITITLRYFDTSGAEVDTVTDTLPPLGSRTYTPTGVFSGSLMITATEDIGVIATDSPLDSNRAGDSLMSYRGVERQDGGTQINLLPIYRGYQGWNSRFAVQNTEDTVVPITITFYNLTGTAVYSQVDNLPPHSAHLYDAAEISDLGTDFYGRAQVENPGWPNLIAGVGKAVNSQTGEAVAHNNHPLEPASSQHIYLPLVMKNHTSSIVVYNMGTTEATSNTITLYDQDGITVTTYGPFSLAAHAVKSISLNDPGWSPVVTAGFKGSARVYRGVNPIGALVDTTWPSTPGTFTGYSGVWGSAPFYVPFVRNSAGGDVTQVSVQNIGSEEAEVAVTYYDESGGQVGRETATVKPLAARYFDQASSGLPASFSGSAVVTSTRSIVVTGLISRGRLNMVYLPLVVRNQ